MEVDLQENIAELFTHACAIIGLNRIDKFVGLFQQVLDK